jgi:hypothetical protein
MKMTGISLWRLYLLRAAYLLVAGGLAVAIWPAIIDHEPGWPLMNGVVAAMLGALSLLAALGLRYPLQMLPVLLFEIVWKAIWLSAVALPLWSADAIDARSWQTVTDCLVAVPLILAIPWDYVVSNYVKGKGERWR